MREEKIYFENQGEKIEGILHLPDNSTHSLVILVHGFTGSKNGPDKIFIKLAKKIAAEGFAVLRFNFRFTSEDLSEFYKMTIRGEVSDLKLIISEMSKRYKKIALVGESMGGTISILSYDEKIKCLVLWYPAIFIRETELKDRFLSKKALQELEETGFITGFIKGEKSDGREYRISRECVEEIKNINLIPYIEKISCPTLLIHGDSDAVVPFNQSERLLKILKGPKKLEKIVLELDSFAQAIKVKTKN